MPETKSKELSDQGPAQGVITEAPAVKLNPSGRKLNPTPRTF